MAFLHSNFDNFELRDLGHSDFLSFKVLAPTLVLTFPEINVWFIYDFEDLYY